MSLPEGLTAISLDEIAQLDVKDKKRSSKKEVNTNRRDHDTWFKLHTSLGVCENPFCPDDRPKKVAEGNAMVAKVENTMMCRICFLSGWLAHE